MSTELHIFSLAAVLALVYWALPVLSRFITFSDEGKQAVVFVAVFVAGIADNAVFFSGNPQLINVVTTLYGLAILAAGAVGTLKVAQAVSRGIKAFATYRHDLWQVNVETRRAQIAKG